MRKNSFTLIELMIVLAILGIIASVIEPHFVGAHRRGGEVVNQVQLVGTRLDGKLYNVDSKGALLPTSSVCQ
jgi:prepilin-type N-terminal cleavage/methylation domain-containing protein